MYPNIPVWNEELSSYHQRHINKVDRIVIAVAHRPASRQSCRAARRSWLYAWGRWVMALVNSRGEETSACKWSKAGTNCLSVFIADYWQPSWYNSVKVWQEISLLDVHFPDWQRTGTGELAIISTANNQVSSPMQRQIFLYVNILQWRCSCCHGY